MQKLEKRHNTPTDAPQVRSNCDSVVKHDCVVGQVSQNTKTFSNSSDVDLPQHIEEVKPKMYVFVLNKDGTPLMPCKPAKARHLLEQKKAKVVQRKPFAIQLLWDCENNTHDISLGLDSGFKYVGVSAVNEENNQEVFSAEFELRDDIPKKMEQRRKYRRIRRGHLWYRKPRFNNRGRDDGWLAPSIQHKIDSHLRIVGKLKELLPIKRVAVEVASFDIQRIKNPDIQGKEYQNGEQSGFWNTREYVIHRDNHTCQHCHGKKKDPILQLHHINGKTEGATNRPDELLTVCKTCHDEHHKGIDVIPRKKVKQFKPETFMTTVRWKIVNKLQCSYTFGYITKGKRIENDLVKSHVNDAFVIAGGTKDVKRCKSYSFKQVRRNNRSIQTNRKGFDRSIRRKRYSLQPNDCVKHKNALLMVKGMHCYGKRAVLENKLSVAIKNLELICYGKGIFGYKKNLNSSTH